MDNAVIPYIPNVSEEEYETITASLINLYPYVKFRAAYNEITDQLNLAAIYNSAGTDRIEDMTIARGIIKRASKRANAEEVRSMLELIAKDATKRGEAKNL